MSDTLPSGTIVLLPFATPTQQFPHPWSAFHPAALLYPNSENSSGRNTKYIDREDYSGYSVVKMATSLSHTVVATIPPKSTAAGLALDSLLSSFVNPDNILSEVERVETDESTIAGQVKVVLEMYPHAGKIVVVWPYQMVDLKTPILAKAGERMYFGYSHPNLNVRRDTIPECIVLSTTIPQTEDSLCECKDVQEHAQLDSLLKGEYTRVLSMVELDRQEFFDFTSSPTYPNLTLLVKQSIKGKEGALVNPESHTFI